MWKFSYTCKVLAGDYSREFPAGLLSIRLEFCEKSSHRVSYLGFSVAKLSSFNFSLKHHSILGLRVLSLSSIGSSR
jgi:hypothetical protein